MSRMRGLRQLGTLLATHGSVGASSARAGRELATATLERHDLLPAAALGGVRSYRDGFAGGGSGRGDAVNAMLQPKTPPRHIGIKCAARVQQRSGMRVNVPLWASCFSSTDQAGAARRIVPEQTAFVVERFGRYKKTLTPGIHVLIPIVSIRVYGPLFVLHARTVALLPLHGKKRSCK